ncbi:hypothetical protein KR018_003452, partial [Drosophila ironensis]
IMSWPKQSASLWLPLLLGLLYTQHASTFIVPRELPSLLSIVYSNIPPIKKGTDSRLGFGFRLGEHADFQVMVELGPQKETRPIGMQSSDEQSFSKRQVSSADKKALLREQYRQQVKLEAERLMTSTERNAASWLETWSNGMKPQKPHPKEQRPRPRRPANPQPQDPNAAMQQLQMLYKMATTSSSTTSSTTTPPPPIFAGGALGLGGPSGFKLPPPALEQDSNALGNPEPIKSKSEITKELMDVSLDTKK